MADIAPQGFVNYGLSQAQQGQATASANLENQQATAASLQNQMLAAKMPALMEGYRQAEKYITGYGGQTNGRNMPAPDYDPDSDSSGAVPAGGTPGSNRVSSYDLIGRNGTTNNMVQSALQGKYNVDPSGTQQEQAAIRQAYDYKAHIDMLGDKGLSDSAQAALDSAIKQRDMNVVSRRNQNQLQTSKDFEGLQAANGADHPYDALQAANPAAAARIKAQLPTGASQAQLDAAAEDATAKAAGFIHRFTGRETITGKDGIKRDKDTEMPIPGVPPEGFTQAEIQSVRESGLNQVEVFRNGVKTSMMEYQAAGFHNIDDYVNGAVSMARGTQQSLARIETQRQKAVAIQAHAGMPADQRIPAPGQKQRPSTAAAAAVQAQTPAPQNVSTNAKISAADAKAPTSPNVNDQQGGKLDFSDSPKLAEGAPGNSDMTPGQRKVSEEVAQNPQVASERVQGANAMLQGVNNARIALNSGAATGPNQAMRTWVQATLNNPAALHWALGNSDATQVLTKVLGNDAIKAIMNEAQGAQFRLGSNTMNMAMNALAASPNMGAGAIRAMIGAMEKNANYDRQKWGDDFAAYQRNASKDTDRRASAYSAWYDTKYPNRSHIDQHTLNGQESGPTITSQADYDKLPDHAPYYHPDHPGKTLYKNGQK